MKEEGDIPRITHIQSTKEKKNLQRKKNLSLRKTKWLGILGSITEHNSSSTRQLYTAGSMPKFEL